MKITRKCDTPVLVIIGGWNANILLNPKWLSKYLFPEQKNLVIELPAPPSFPAPPRVSTSDVRLALTGPKLLFTPLNPAVAVLDHIEQLGIKIADYLPHTPVSAVGINFTFEVEGNMDEELVLASEVSASAAIEKSLEAFGEISETLHRYTLKRDGGILNLSIQNRSTGSLSCAFNFHNPIDSLAEFKELMADHPVTEYQSIAMTVLNAICHNQADGDE